MNPDALIGLAQASGFLVLASTGIGVFVGLLVGMIPGMTISTGIIVVLPATFVLPADISIALLLGLYVGGMTGGSFSAVLLNIPDAAFLHSCDERHQRQLGSVGDVGEHGLAKKGPT